MLKTVRPDLPFLVVGQALVAREDEVYDVWVNRHGAVSVILEEGVEKAAQLGVKPDEFVIVAWHEPVDVFNEFCRAREIIHYRNAFHHHLFSKEIFKPDWETLTKEWDVLLGEIAARFDK